MTKVCTERPGTDVCVLPLRWVQTFVAAGKVSSDEKATRIHANEPIRSVRLEDYRGADALDSLLVRTDFSDDDTWSAVVTKVSTRVAGPDGDAGLGDLVVVDDATADGITPAELVARIGATPPFYLFVADARTMVDLEHTVVAVEFRSGLVTLRVAPTALWMIENSLLTSTADLATFVSAADTDGVFRGFGSARVRVPYAAGEMATVDLNTAALLRAVEMHPTPWPNWLETLASELTTHDPGSRTFHRVDADVALSFLDGTDLSDAESLIGHAELREALRHVDEVLTGSLEFDNGHWAFFLTPRADRIVGAYKYVFR